MGSKARSTPLRDATEMGRARISRLSAVSVAVLKHVTIGGRSVGDGQPAYLVAEIGINHNGSIDIAK
jgi:hypothetical protein